MECTRRRLLAGMSGAALLSAPARGGSGAAPAPGSTPAPASIFQWPVHPLLQANPAQSLDRKVRAKQVIRTLVVDDMSTDRWHGTPGAALSYSTERSMAGGRSLRMQVSQRDPAYIAASRLPNCSFSGEGVLFEGSRFAAAAHLHFDQPQDWRAYDRISLWCYLHPTAIPITSIAMGFVCEGAPAGPSDPIAMHYISDLEPGSWTHLTWEIPEQHRDRVVAFILFETISGVPVRNADPVLIFDFSRLALEQVHAEPVSGWGVAPGTLAYSHLGYPIGGAKIAIADMGQSETFELIRQADHRVAYTGQPRSITTRRGSYARLDFSDFAVEGVYRLRAGATLSEPFAISDTVWRPLVQATLNAFYGMRCGFAVPGVHDACHCDVFVTHGGQTRSLGGGWHDAANLTQGPGRTHLSIYALCELHEALLPVDAALAARALEEACWGAEWSLRMRFGPGLRCLYGHYSFYTDGQAGTADDVRYDNVGNDAFQNILAVLAGARAARALRARPAFADALLAAAAQDFEVALRDRPVPPSGSPPIGINEGSWRDEVGYLTLAAVELHRAAPHDRTREAAVSLGTWLMALQELGTGPGIPLTGYFYEDAARSRIVHEYHNSFEESGPAALAALCDTFPDHPHWIRWYAALTAYSEFFCRQGSTASAPFDILPAAVWRRTDLGQAAPDDPTGAMLARMANPVFPTAPTPDLVRDQMQAMFDAAVPLGDDHVLRLFPLWYDHVRHGASTVHMSKTAALGTAARVRGRADLGELCARQLMWMTGLNPFSRSVIYGVGNDWWQNFTVSMPNLVGGLGLGFNSYQDDAPAWGNNATFPYKEQWVFASSRIALTLALVAAPARIRGTASAAATVTQRRSGRQHAIAAGAFDLALPAGEYTVACGGIRTSLSLIGGRVTSLDFDPARAIAITLTHRSGADGAIDLTATLRGAGHHDIALLMTNATTDRSGRAIDLVAGTTATMTWRLTITDPGKIWVAVAAPHGNPAARADACGAAQPIADLSSA